MIIEETKITKDNGENVLIVKFKHHKSTIFTTEIKLQKFCKNLKLAQEKEKAIDEFLQSSQKKNYTKQDVLKAYSRIDEYFKDVYKELYPRGGVRPNSGRKVGYVSPKNRSKRTARFTMAITEEEKEFLIKTLKELRLKSQSN
jgi:transcription initiation factor TFIIIB Brf1 subunit/transcription initiation factor TFIIB